MNRLYCIVAVANPHMELRVCECDQSGCPIGKKMTICEAGRPTRRTRLEYETIDVHRRDAGNYWVTTPTVVDHTPRPYAEAAEIARRCPPGEYGKPRGVAECAAHIHHAATRQE